MFVQVSFLMMCSFLLTKKDNELILGKPIKF